MKKSILGSLILLGILWPHTGATEPVTAWEPNAARTALRRIERTPGPAPTHTPTPTPSPAPDLEAGKRYQTIGDYDRAITTYRAFLMTGPEGDAEVEARMRLGETYLARADYEAALDALAAAQQSAGERRPEIAFLLGTAHENAGEIEKAIPLYDAYRDSRPLLADYVGLRIAHAYVALERYQEAIAEYEKVLALEHVSQEIRLDAASAIARAYLELGELDQAAGWIAEMPALVEGDAARAKLMFDLAAGYQTQGREAQARKWFGRLIDELPQQPEAYYAVREYVDLGGEVADYQRGLIYYYGRDYEAAINALHRHVATHADHTGEAHYFRGRAYQRLDRHRDAIAEFDLLTAAHPANRLAGEGWMAKARSVLILEGPSAAADVYREFAMGRPEHALAREALWEIARLWETRGLLSEAASAYLTLAERYPTDRWGEYARFRAGLIAYRRERYSEAREVWNSLTESASSLSRSRALFWIGMAFTQEGRSPLAAPYLEKAARAAPGTFYALRAATLGGEPHPPAFVDGRGGQVGFEQWLRGWAEETGDGEQIETEIKSERSFRRGNAFLQINLHDEAVTEFTRLRDDHETDPATLYRLALLFSDLGLHRLSISCAMRVAWQSPDGTIQGAPPYLQRLAYPLPFADLITDEAEGLEIDPLLLFALIRQESWFDPKAGSTAGAIGLTQVIPETGDWIALQLRRRDFEPDDLYRPIVSVEFGAWYFAQQLESFESEPFYALAAYNGGPTKVKRWREGIEGPDLFVEVIDVWETRTFVQRVYEHYARYQMLYGGQSSES